MNLDAQLETLGNQAETEHQKEQLTANSGESNSCYDPTNLDDQEHVYPC